MTSHFIPMLSSTPPPMEECGSFEEEDDEFGDFTAAAWTLSDDSPTKKSPHQVSGEQIPDAKQTHQSNGHVESHPIEELHLKNLTNGIAEEESEWTAEFQIAEESHESSQTSINCSNGQCSPASPAECSSRSHTPTEVTAVNGLANSNAEDGASDTPKGKEVEDLNLGSYSEIDVSTRVVSCDEEDDFADFAIAQFRTNENLEEGASGVEDFAAFEQAEFTDGPSEQWADFESNEKEDSSVAQSKILKMLHSAFPQEEQHFESPVLPDKQVLRNDDSLSTRLWSRLEDLDHSVSLHYQWNGSRAFQRLLYALNIDSRNIEIIPPAQFDWSSSGLVNPLDSMQSSSSLLDLDFFVRSSSTSSGTAPTSSLEAEFLGPDLPSTSANPVLLQQLLKHSKSTMLECSGRPAQLSEAAIRILDQLPDLSFMRAKVLMFPVRCTLES